MSFATGRIGGVLLATVCTAVLASQAARAEFPEKPVEMTVLFGGSAQTIGQVLADLMSKQLGQPVVAVSRPGGGGALGYTHVKGTEPDGHNIVWNSNSISTVHHQGNLPFDYTAFTPIARIGMEVPVLAVRTDKGWDTLQAMVDDVKASGQKLKVGISGLGSFTHLASAALFDRLGLDVIYVPYGEGRAPAELLAGRIDAAIQWPSQFVPHVQSGEVKVLCATAKEQTDLPIEAPPCDQAGAAGLDVIMWRGLAAPAGTPPEAVEKLEQAAKAAVETPEFQEAAKNLGFSPAFMPAEQFGELIASDDKKIAELMTDLGLKK